MSKPYVLIIDSVFDSYQPEAEVLEPLGYSIERCRDEEVEAIASLAPDCEAILVNLYPIDRALIRTLAACRAIARYGVGYDTVDVEAASEHGIWVANVCDYATEDVSDHAVALLFGAVRRIPFRDREVRKGGWALYRRQQSRRTMGKVLGIIGYGAIGGTFHRKLSGVSFSRVLVCDPYIDRARITDSGAIPATHEEVYEQADYISLHVPLNDETKHMIDEAALSAMKDDAILINTSRGGVVDTEALVHALGAGRPGYAALDVHEIEPLPSDSPLFALENVVLTDHCAWYTEESLVELKRKTAENVRSVIETGRPVSPVNRPDSDGGGRTT